MQRGLLLGRWFNLPSVYQFCTVFTLADKMSADNVIQLCGNDSPAVRHALKCLEAGGIIALPTDTVYGLAVDSGNSAAIASLYEVKGRDRNKPLAICVGSVSEVKNWGVTDDLPKGLLRTLLPGPVTLLLHRKKTLNPDLNPGENKVGIRVPETICYPFIQLVASTLGRPLALTSANLSNEPNCIYVEEFKPLWPKLAAVFDSSDKNDKCPNNSREGSTIVDLTEKGSFRITRPGVALDQTCEILQKYKLRQVT